MNNELSKYEPGEDVTDQYEPSKRTGIVVSVRLPYEDSERLMDLADESGRTVSQIARQAIRAFLHGGRPEEPEVSATTDPQGSLHVQAPIGGGSTRSYYRSTESPTAMGLELVGSY